jgi:lincosamide nucleotidyltransferase A/C/D/E
MSSSSRSGMRLSEVHAILLELDAAGCRIWVAGGWGVDALVGYQSRAHRDLDLAVDAEDMSAALLVLERRGYCVETDWRPVRVELVCVDVGRVDLHPVVFEENGRGRQGDFDGAHFDYPQAAFDVGTLDGLRVRCLAPAQQLSLHSGYELRPVDLHDLRLLHALTAGPDAQPLR